MIHISLYLSSIILSIVMLWILMFVHSNRISPYLYMMFTTTTVVNTAYFLIATAKDISQAMTAWKFASLIETFLPFFFILSICDICKIKINHIYIIPVVLLNLILAGIVATYEHSTNYVLNVQLVNENGFSYLIKNYGFGHHIFTIVNYIYMIIPILLIFYAHKRRKYVSYIYTSLLATGAIFIIALELYENINHTTIELIPFGYNIIELIILYILNKTELYDTTRNVSKFLDSTKLHGYIILDKSYRLKSYDNNALVFSPELSKVAVDTLIFNHDFYAKYKQWAKKAISEKVEPMIVHHGMADIKIEITPFYSTINPKKHLGFIVEISDDTLNQKYIAELESINEKLSTMNDQYQKLAIEADSANRAKSNFMSLMSHEIRTPLNAIIGLNDLIIRQTSDQLAKEYATDAFSSSQWLLALINDILDYSKIEAGKMELVNVNYNLKALLTNLGVIVAPIAEEKKLKLITKIDLNLPNFLFGDETKIRQILINLMTNAVKYTDKGSITFSLSDCTDEYINAQTENNAEIIYLKFVVSDTGRGIKKESIPNLFSAFSRLDEEKNNGIEGTGLGLNITNNFVSMMGGHIEVDSVYGEGSSFTVIIPQCINSEKKQSIAEYTLSEKQKEEDNSSEITALPTIDLSGMRILSIDDVKINLKLFSIYLENTGAQIDLAESGAQALVKCESTRYDLIFVDHMMSGIDGIEFLHHLQNGLYPLNKDVPVIILTANNVPNDGAEYKEEGFTEYLSKPYRAENLISVISKVLNK